MNLLSSTDPVTDRRVNLLLVASIITMLAVVIGALIGIPKLLSSASTTDAIRRSSDVTACRSFFRVDVDDAVARLTAAKAKLDTLTNRGLEASVRRDTPELTTLLGQLEPARVEVENDATAVTTATDLYRRRVKRSTVDPDSFLAECRAAQRGT